MTPITPLMPRAVRLPDGRVGVLIGRIQLIGCVMVGRQRILEAVPLSILWYWHYGAHRDSGEPQAVWGSY